MSHVHCVGTGHLVPRVFSGGTNPCVNVIHDVFPALLFSG